VAEAIPFVLLFLLMRGEPDQTVVELVNSQRVEAGDHNVYSQILLLVVDKVWTHDLLADDSVILVFDHTLLPDHFDAPPTRGVRWLQDPELLVVSLFFLVQFESLLVRWEDVRVRTLVLLFREFAFEDGIVAIELIFTPQLPTMWEMVHSLEKREFPQEFGFAGDEPQHVPLVTLGLLEAAFLKVGYHAVLLVGVNDFELQVDVAVWL